MARPIANPITYGTLSGNVPMSDLDTSFGALFTTGFNDSSLGWVNYAADTGVANAYAVTLGVTPSSYTAGMCVAFTPQNTNTGTSTINVNSLGTKSIVTPANIALNGGEINKNQLCVLVYDGTSFRISGTCGLSLTSTGNASGVTINCAGYTYLNLEIHYTVVTVATTLNNVSEGIPIMLEIVNNSGGSGAYSVAMTNAAGAAMTIFSIQSGQSTGASAANITSGTGSLTISNTSSIYLLGGLISSTQAVFSR